MKKDKINCLQFSSMLSMLLVASFLGIGTFSVIKAAGVDAYISIIIAAIAGSFILLSFFVIYDYEPELNVAEKFKKVFGKPFGTILNYLCLGLILFMGISAMFNLTTFITSQFLKATPPFLIGLGFAFLIILVNIKGIETLSRTCLILFTLCVILFLISIIGLFPEFDIGNLKPCLEYGFKRPLIGALYNFLFNLMPIYLLLIVPKNNLVKPEKYRKYMWIFYILSFLIKFTLVVITLGVLGIHLASIYQYPEYMVLKRIQIFTFIDRIENVITIQWLFGLFFNISFVVYYITNSIKQNHKSKLLPIIITILIFLGSVYLFKNNTDFNNFTYNKVPYMRAILLFIYILLFIGVLIKKKFNKKVNS
ncbi:MAG: endospore germination permease [Bacilli bacterium]|nr:endospore germination permease [Bacilli bacterium]